MAITIALFIESTSGLFLAWTLMNLCFVAAGASTGRHIPPGGSHPYPDPRSGRHESLAPGAGRDSVSM